MDRILRFFGLCRIQPMKRELWIQHCASVRMAHEIDSLKRTCDLLTYEVGNYRSACKGYREQISRMDEMIIH